ncbi:MAG: addiction module protein [Gemmataceae bacterium]
MSPAIRDAVFALSPAEKLDLIGELWDALEEDQVPVTPELIELIEQRKAARLADPSRGVPWEHVLRRVRAKYGR